MMSQIEHKMGLCTVLSTVRCRRIIYFMYKSASLIPASSARQLQLTLRWPHTAARLWVGVFQ